MLSELHVQNLALVEDVWLEFGPGLTALTGETGAGKTVLVEALKLLLGERADSTMVRHGAAEALVEGRFVLEGREVVVRRRLTAEGRSRCAIDGEMATVGMLAELLGGQVDLHGQHEHQALLSSSRHAGYFDRFIGPPAAEASARFREAFAELKEAESTLAALEAMLADRDRREDYLRFVVADIETVAPEDGEDEALQARLPKLRHGERLMAAATAAFESLKGEGGASDALGSAMSGLAGVGGLDPSLDELAAEIERLDVEVQDAAGMLRTYAESVEHDPGELDRTERRLQQLGDLARKYGPTLADARATLEGARAELETLDAGEEGLTRARAEAEAARERIRDAAQALIRVRDEAVGPFSQRLAAASADLALAGAAFEVARAPLPETAWGAEGPERVEFLFAASAGERPRPLARVASGGEISRVMLALKSVLGGADQVPILVFDEIDAGIGGATARAVGRRLAALASGRQVLVVTHLPQVAAYASAHVVVTKEESAGRTVTVARPLVSGCRESEIARMLSGDDSETSRAHARELLEASAAECGGRDD